MPDDVKQSFDKALESIGLDNMFLIKEMFLGYKYRKREKILYDQDRELPAKLIKLYFSLKCDMQGFDTIQKAFITHYVHEESKIEGLDIKTTHSRAEVDGCRKMYEFIHSPGIDDGFSIYTLKELHRILYSYAPYPEAGGTLRNDDRFLPGTGVELCPWRQISERLYKLSPVVDELVQVASAIRESKDANDIINYIDRVVELKCELIKIHPFQDGNGRSIRGFINKLLEYAALPPIYIKINEKTEYHKAMNKANVDGDYSDIKNFYKYKICDSIVELDINERIREDKEQARRRLIQGEKKNC